MGALGFSFKRQVPAKANDTLDNLSPSMHSTHFRLPRHAKMNRPRRVICQARLGRVVALGLLLPRIRI